MAGEEISWQFQKRGSICSKTQNIVQEGSKDGWQMKFTCLNFSLFVDILKYEVKS